MPYDDDRLMTLQAIDTDGLVQVTAAPALTYIVQESVHLHG